MTVVSSGNHEEENTPSLSEKRWTLAQEYRGRIRLQAYAVVAGLPIGAIAILSSPLMRSSLAVHALAVVLALAEFALLYNLIVAVNGHRSVSECPESLWTNKSCGKFGKVLACFQVIGFTVLALVEFGCYTLFVDCLIARIVLWLLLLFPLALYVWASFLRDPERQEDKRNPEFLRIWGAVLASLIVTMLIWAFYIYGPAHEFQNAVEQVTLDGQKASAK